MIRSYLWKVSFALIVAFNAASVSAQNLACERVWRGGCKQDIMDEVAEKMKSIWNDELPNVGKHSNRLRYRIENVEINPTTVAIAYRGISPLVSAPNADINVIYGISDMNDSLTAIPLMGGVTSFTTSDPYDDIMEPEVLKVEPTSNPRKVLTDSRPMGVFRMALQATVANNGIIADGVPEKIWLSDSTSDGGPETLVSVKTKDGKSKIYRLTKEGLILSITPYDGKLIDFEGSVNLVSNGLISPVRYQNMFDPANYVDLLGRRYQQVAKDSYYHENDDLTPFADPYDFPANQHYLSGRKEIGLMETINLGEQGYFGTFPLAPYGRYVVVRNLYGFKDIIGGCGPRGCLEFIRNYYSGVSFFDEKVVSSMVDRATNKVLVVTYNPNHISFNFEVYDPFWKEEQVMMMERETSNISFAQLGITGTNVDLIGSARDIDGRIFTVGNFLHSSGKKRYFIIKHDMEGNVVWSKIYSGSTSKQVNKVLVDWKGNLLLVGKVGEAEGSAFDNYVAEIDRNGTVKNEQQWGNVGADEELHVVDYSATLSKIVTAGSTIPVDFMGNPIPNVQKVTFRKLDSVVFKK